MTSRRTLLKGTLLGGAAALLPTAASAAGGGPVLRLPAPSGPHPVGMRTVHLTDPDRSDPWVGGAREVMLTVLYPARSVRGLARVAQLTRAEAEVFAGLAPRIHPGLPEPGTVDWGAVLTHGYRGAPPLPGRRPVLVYSPGGGDSRTLGTTLAEDLASHGRVVVLVDHPGDASQVELPTGMRTTALTGPPDPATFATMVDTRIADLRLVLDRLGTLPLAPVMDACRIGLYGHSAGGTAVVGTAQVDRRVGAVANLEGYLDLAPRPVGFDRPLLLLRTDGFEGAARLDSSWAGVPSRRAMFTDANHWAFTDYGSLVPRLQAAGLVTAATRAALVGTGDPVVTLAEVRRRVGTFFARSLATTRVTSP
ncbi:acetylhydrolase [Streptomyces sp. VRA16 Mangrove soil]|uniref:alpha/beta hydrolase family protein n=1 Tax=Streptomyces sp. VRA16 Mangrove soil TaxID=2817434 RepID=UPI001A9DDC2D|nr:acetylhydrolase [Streptomyces sp. VRA16 Mangrove soil]MBO1329918.1 acetylhydrolase [Streptomyces sp. VRA16 Mangrove soil]